MPCYVYIASDPSTDRDKMKYLDQHRIYINIPFICINIPWRMSPIINIYMITVY